MEDKESYTPEEVKEMFSAYAKYTSYNLLYALELADILQQPSLEEYKKTRNNYVEECKKKIPRSLIDKLGIKKIE